MSLEKDKMINHVFDFNKKLYLIKLSNMPYKIHGIIEIHIQNFFKKIHKFYQNQKIE